MIVEHPFGTIKRSMGLSYFLTRTMESVKTEISLAFFAYDMKRLINIVGTKEIIKRLAGKLPAPNLLNLHNYTCWKIKDFSIQGYIVDKERLKNGSFLNEEYFDHLLEEIREIRASKRRFYQKITDIYATAMDYSYSPTAITTRKFFKTVQNKLHFAIHGKTAASALIFYKINFR